MTFRIFLTLRVDGVSFDFVEGPRLDFTPEERRQIRRYDEAWGDPASEEAQQVQAGIGGSLTIEALASLPNRMVRTVTVAEQQARAVSRISVLMPNVIVTVGGAAIVAWLGDYGVKNVGDLTRRRLNEVLTQCEMLARQRKSIIQAAQFLADTAPTHEYRDIVDRVID